MTTHSSVHAWRIAMDKETQATVHGVAKSQTRLSDEARTHTQNNPVFISNYSLFPHNPSLSHPPISPLAVLCCAVSLPMGFSRQEW